MCVREFLPMPALALAFLLASLQAGSSQVADSEGGGGRNDRECPTCISVAQDNSLRALLEKHREKMAKESPGTPSASGDPQPYTFYPHAGILSGGDTYLGNYTDRDATSGILDSFCTDRTYDGHRGIDTGILYWDMQDIGVPVFAALGGTVIAAHDGEFDRNTSWEGQPANLVVIDHGDGHISRYFHFKKNSVAVAVNDVVTAGQQIGLVGSSGNSTGPHLHFQTELNGVVTEPFAGPCGPSSSLFLRQPVAHPQMFIRELTIADQDLTGWSGPPERTASRGAFMVNTTPVIYFWLNLVNMEPDATYRFRYLRPNGSVALDNGTRTFSSFYNWSWWWWSRTVSLNVPGTWTLEYSLNGQVVVEAPFDVVSSAGQIVNRAPNAAPVVFENPPVENEVPVCRVTNFSVVDDPDYDLVRYRYVWKVNNVTRRDVVSAALSDALPEGIVGAGDVLVCEVTPNDGALNGAMSSVTAQIPGGLAPEITIQQPAGVSLTDALSTVDYGNVGVSSSQQRTFTIRNDGNANLTGLSVAISGPDSSRFTTSQPGSVTLAPGGSTFFVVTYSPNAVGVNTATVQVASNDFDENPFDIALSGTGALPEIGVNVSVDAGGSVSLNDGTGTVSFGGIALGSSKQKTFTINNTGAGPLTGLAVSVSGTDAAQYTPGTLGSTTVPPGGSTTFSVTFTPVSAGAKTAALQIASNDSDENPFDISLSGSGTVPEIDIEHPPGNGLVDGSSSLDFATVAAGGSVQKTLTVRNSGLATLSGLTVAADGPDAAKFSLGAFGSTSLAAGASTTLTVTFAPANTGAHVATLHIGSNDSDENPFDIGLTGTGTGEEISVEYPPATPLTDGSATISFGDSLVGTGVQRTLTIRNNGTENLTGLGATFSGGSAAMYQHSPIAPTTLAPGASTTFTVTFTPAATGTRTTGLRIASSDFDENPFDISLSGVGSAPEITVSSPFTTNLVDGVSTRDFGPAVVNEGLPQTFRIRNAGSYPLTGLATSIDGVHADDFVAEPLPLATLNPGQSTDFDVIFTPSVEGIRQAALHISSNDGDENPFDINLAGSGGTPEIAVEFPTGVSLTDGASTAVFDVHFGDIVRQFFVIRNTGSAPLSGISASIDGANAADFHAYFLSSNNVMPGGEATLWIAYDRATLGDSIASLHIQSGDTDESPFDIELRGARLQATTLRSWAEGFGLSGSALDPGLDEDNDGASLLEEYAFGLDPTVADFHYLTADTGTSGLPLVRLIGAGDDAFLRAQFLRRRTDSNLVYDVEFGDNLGEIPPDGFTSATEPESTVPIDTDFSRTSVDDSVTAAGHPERFGRVKVSYDPGG